MVDYAKILSEIEKETLELSKVGESASYIPELKKVNPDKYGMCLRTIDGQEYKIGDSEERFSIQSISKVMSLAMAISLLGDKVWRRVGVEPSGMPFNSLIQLEMERGYPRNPLINSGAMVISDILLTVLKNPEEEFLEFVRNLCGCNDINYNDDVAKSEYQCGYMNAAIANILKHYGNIENNIDNLLKFYYHQCSIEMNCSELARAFNNFSDHSRSLSVGNIQLTSSRVKRLNAIMQLCGLYDEAGEFSYLVGLPAKSGVGGGIVALCPQVYSVAVWSPRLNRKGNSVRGVKSLELLTTKSKISVF